MLPNLITVRRVAALLLTSCIVAGCGGGSGDHVVADAASPTSPTDATADVVSADLGPGSPSPGGAGPGVVVDVSGLVARPGVYRMQPGSRVHEAIAAAGGARRGAQLAGINRAAVLVDGQQVVVSAGGPAVGIGSGAASGASGGGPGGSGARVSINSADAAALDALPGIGPVTAQKIVDDREQSGPFASVDDLDRVPGIGPATVDALRDAVTP